MFDGRDLDDADRLIDDWPAGIEARPAQARMSAFASSDDDLVGVGTALQLDEGIRRQPAEDTARSILVTMHAAQAALTATATEVTAETVGADSATGQAVIASFQARRR